MSVYDMDASTLIEAFDGFNSAIDDFISLMKTVQDLYYWVTFWLSYDMDPSVPALRPPLATNSQLLFTLAAQWRNAISDGTLTENEALSLFGSIDQAITALTDLQVKVRRIVSRIQWIRGMQNPPDPAMVQCAPVAIHALSPLMRFDPVQGMEQTGSYLPGLVDALEQYKAVLYPFLPLSPPTNLSASDGAFTDHIHLSWDASPIADGYDVYRNTENVFGSAVKVLTTAGRDNTVLDDRSSSLVPGQAYWYWVVSRTYEPSRTSGPSLPDSGSIAAQLPKYRYGDVVTCRSLGSTNPWAAIEPTTQFYYGEDPNHLCMRIELNDVYRNGDYDPLLTVRCMYYRLMVLIRV